MQDKLFAELFFAKLTSFIPIPGGFCSFLPEHTGMLHKVISLPDEHPIHLTMIYSNPLVSVAMATCNGSDYVDQQLRSILNQTYPNLEIVITDDASTDGTLAILYGFKNKYKNIKIFCNPTPLGITSNYEHSIKNCKGDYIALSAQDDIWDLNKIQVLLHAMKNEDLIYSDSELIDKDGSPLNKLISSSLNLGPFKSGAPFIMGSCLPGHCMLMQGDFARYILPIPRVLTYERWISFCAAANNGINYLDVPLARTRRHDSSHYSFSNVHKRKNSNTNKDRFHKKFMELKACERAPVKDKTTLKLLQEMLSLFTPKISLARSRFFFRNRNLLLTLRKRSGIHQILFCVKMFFKPNY